MVYGATNDTRGAWSEIRQIHIINGGWCSITRYRLKSIDLKFFGIHEHIFRRSRTYFVSVCLIWIFAHRFVFFPHCKYFRGRHRYYISISGFRCSISMKINIFVSDIQKVWYQSTDLRNWIKTERNFIIKDKK